MRAKMIGALVALAAAVPVAVTTAAAAPPARSVYIVVLHDGADSGGVAAEHARAHGAEPRYVYEHALRGYAASMTEQAAASIARDPRVRSIERDQVASIAQTVPTGVQRIFADDNATLDIDGSDDLRVNVDVAVLDTGIDLDHPDLAVYRSTNCLYTSGTIWNRTYSCGAGGDDDHYHGTHVAGTIGAVDNGIGVVGVAPGARLWAVKVLDSRGSGPIAAIVAGIDYVTANASEIDVANMSLGCECPSTAMSTAIANAVSAGVTFAVAAGNSAKDASTFVPANHPDVITVSALADFDGAPGGTGASTCRADVDDTLASFSNYGPLVEIAAPGVCITSTYPNGSYGTISGTSMASPHVAGAAALLASGDSTMQPAGIRAELLRLGNAGWTDDSGDGIREPLLDAHAIPAATTSVGGGGGGGGGTPPPTGISLQVRPYKVKGIRTADLTWSGASTTVTSMDVYRNGAVVGTTANDGAHTDTIGGKGGGTFVYKVCEAGTATCSPEVSATF